jgi:hypothetical protein
MSQSVAVSGVCLRDHARIPLARLGIVNAVHLKPSKSVSVHNLYLLDTPSRIVHTRRVQRYANRYISTVLLVGWTLSVRDNVPMILLSLTPFL